MFVREVETWGVAYHSPALAEAVPGLTEGMRSSVLRFLDSEAWIAPEFVVHGYAALEKIIPEPKARSTSWISSTYPAGSTDEAAGLVSAQYQVNTPVSVGRLASVMGAWLPRQCCAYFLFLLL